MPVVRSIVKKSAPNNYRLESIVQSIVESTPFQMRTRLESAEPTQSRTVSGTPCERSLARVQQP